MAGQSAQNKSSIIQSNLSKKPKLLIGVVILVLLILGIAGFFIQSNIIKEMVDSTDQSTNSADNNKNGNNQVTVETENGKIEIKEGKIPDNFPDDITIYKGSSIETTTEINNESSIQLKTSDKVSQVADFYKSDLKKNGWKEVKTFSEEGSVLLTVEKDGVTAILVITTDKSDNKTSISISVGIIKT